MKARSFVTPQDIKDIGFDVLRHRIIVSYEAEAEDISVTTLLRKSLKRFPFRK